MAKTSSSTRHLFITGGVVSSLGKGITAASLAFLLKRRGYRVSMQKLDPYLNVDPGTMSPYQHGEVYVTDDGTETDLDLGHYERFAEVECSHSSNFTSGRIYRNVIDRERRGDYLGQTIQVIPHVTEEIKASIRQLDQPDVDIAITEIGGTVGDIESQPFLEAIRQFRYESGAHRALVIHLTLVPYIRAAGEMKTKPSQQSVGILREIGIIPDMLICRCEREMEEEHFRKLALFCNVPRHLVFAEQDVANTIYEVPVELSRQKLDKHVLELLDCRPGSLRIDDWKEMIKRLLNPSGGEIEIALVGKYTSLRDAYKSIYEALDHGGAAHDRRVKVRPVEAEELTDLEQASELLKGCAGILIPGGFGDRGIEGKIIAAQYAREKLVPFLGICLGMQCAVIEFARHVCDLPQAHSDEFSNATPDPVISLMADQKQYTDKGGTMRLGAYPCELADQSLARTAYNQAEISERHRHRYEFNNHYRQLMSDRGMLFSGLSPDKQLVEIIEISSNPWFVACQFHPEFKSRPLQAHPLFKDFIAAAMKEHKRNA